MDKKILLQNLAENLAERTGLSKRKAEAFVRSFFEITEEALQADGQIKVKNFGTTKIVNVSQRESVNINTGERFQIDGHAKISFTPDTPFRDLVNRPFAHFTTIILEDEVDEAELNAAAQQSLDNEEDENEEETVENTEKQENNTTSNEQNKEVPAIPTIEDNKETTAYEELSVVPTLSETSETEQADSNIAAESESASAEEETPSEEEETPAEEEETPAEEEETPAEEDDIAAEEEVSDEDSIGSTDEVTSNPSDSGTKVPIIINNTLPTPHHNWWRTAFIILAVTLLTLASYFAGYFRVFCPCSFMATETETVTTAETLVADSVARADSIARADSVARADSIAKAKTDSIALVAEKAAKQLQAQQIAAQKAAEKLASQQAAAEKATARQQELAAAAKYNQLPGGRYLITGVMQTRQVKYGENLYMIARRYYGHKDFARYIIFHNNISDPNLVTVGQRIQLPKLTKR